VAAFAAPADATAARPSISLEPLPIAILKTYKGHDPWWPALPRLPRTAGQANSGTTQLL